MLTLWPYMNKDYPSKEALGPCSERGTMEAAHTQIFQSTLRRTRTLLAVWVGVEPSNRAKSLSSFAMGMAGTEFYKKISFLLKNANFIEMPETFLLKYFGFK